MAATNISHWRCGSIGERVAISDTRSGWSSSAWASAARSPADGGVKIPARVSDLPILVVAFSSAMSTCSAWICMASLVTLAVTLGLPSRSPPIQLP